MTAQGDRTLTSGDGSEVQRTPRVFRLWIVNFEYRDDNGPNLVGPFPDRDDATDWVDEQQFTDAVWNIEPLYHPAEAVAS